MIRNSLAVARYVFFAEDNRVVQTLPANGPDHSFGKTVVPWRARCDGFVANAHSAQAVPYNGAERTVSVADEIDWC